MSILHYHAAQDPRAAAWNMCVSSLWKSILWHEVRLNVQIKGIESFEAFMDKMPAEMQSEVINMALSHFELNSLRVFTRLKALLNRLEQSPCTLLRGLSVELPPMDLSRYGGGGESGVFGLPLLSYFKPRTYSSQTYLHPFSGMNDEVPNSLEGMTHIKLHWHYRNASQYGIKNILSLQSIQKIWLCIDTEFWSTGAPALYAKPMRSALKAGVKILITMKEVTTPPILLVRALRRYIEKTETYPHLVVLHDTEPAAPMTLPWETNHGSRYVDVLDPDNTLIGVFDM